MSAEISDIPLMGVIFQGVGLALRLLKIIHVFAGKAGIYLVQFTSSFPEIQNFCKPRTETL